MLDYRKQQQQNIDRDESMFNTENLISFEKVFKQQVKEQQLLQQQHLIKASTTDSHLIHQSLNKYSVSFNRSHSPLPGNLTTNVDFLRTTRAASKRQIQEEDAAARKIQRAFRSYMNRRRFSQHQSRYNSHGNSNTTY